MNAAEAHNQKRSQKSRFRLERLLAAIFGCTVPHLKLGYEIPYGKRPLELFEIVWKLALQWRNWNASNANGHDHKFQLHEHYGKLKWMLPRSKERGKRSERQNEREREREPEKKVVDSHWGEIRKTVRDKSPRAWNAQQSTAGKNAAIPACLRTHFVWAKFYFFPLA